jgi:hypothetical protein
VIRHTDVRRPFLGAALDNVAHPVLGAVLSKQHRARHCPAAPAAAPLPGRGACTEAFATSQGSPLLAGVMKKNKTGEHASHFFLNDDAEAQQRIIKHLIAPYAKGDFHQEYLHKRPCTWIDWSC